MINYVATFHSHYGALTFCKELQNAAIPAELIPVPRKLSSSCGICVSFEHEDFAYLHDILAKSYEFDSLYRREGDEFVSICQNQLASCNSQD